MFHNKLGLFALRNLQDMDAINTWIGKQCMSENGNKMHAVVAGAGFVGLEMVEQLQRRGLRVTVVEMMPQVLGPLDVEMAQIVEDEMDGKGVTIVTGDGIQEFLPSGEDDDTSTVSSSVPAVCFNLLKSSRGS